MNELEDLFQEKMEQVEAGEPLEVCLIGLPAEDAELLRLATMLRDVPYPQRDSEVVINQRAGLLRTAIKERTMTNQSTPTTHSGTLWDSLRQWLQGRTAFEWAVGALLAPALVILLVATVFAGLSSDRGPIENRESPAAAVAGVDEDATAAPGATRAGATPTGELPVGSGADSTEPTTTSGGAAVAEEPQPQQALLQEVEGVVEVQMGDGNWRAVAAGHALQAGQRVRTGTLASATLAFFDGSQAHLGPDSELWIDELNAQMAGAPRIVRLTQWLGESSHDVAPSDNADSHYEVRTPSAVGEARGTSFTVVVTASLLTRFDVSEGEVAVTSVNVTVVVVAGQSTMVAAGQPPEEPVFRITGEGEVTQIGQTWIIAGLSFQTHANTIIVGNPQVGDIVFVEGRLRPDNTRIADQIVLLHRPPADQFTLTGEVVARGETEWNVAGQIIAVDENTTIAGDIEVGDQVVVNGRIREDGTLLAGRIALLQENANPPFNFTGVVQEIGEEAWVISGIPVAVSEATRIDEGLAAGDTVFVEGAILEDGQWQAHVIRQAPETQRGFRFSGAVESIDPWLVAGIAFETRAWTEIDAGIEIGSRVQVTGRIRDDGTWVAGRIERLDHEDEVVQVEFIGRVESTSPWIVGGVSLVANETSVISPGITVGMLVRVRATILPDGAWLIVSLRPVMSDFGQGCFNVVSVVVGAETNQLLLVNGVVIDLTNDLEVIGEVEPGSVIIVTVCVSVDGRFTVVTIIVIFVLDTVPPVPTPTPAPPTPTATPIPIPPPPPEDSGTVTVCHRPPGNPGNAHTITIGRPALQAHLGHGDTLGPC